MTFTKIWDFFTYLSCKIILALLSSHSGRLYYIDYIRSFMRICTPWFPIFSTRLWRYNPLGPPTQSDDDDMEMDISDSDEYDEDEMNKSTALLPGQIDDDPEPLWQINHATQQTPEPGLYIYNRNRLKIVLCSQRNSWPQQRRLYRGNRIRRKKNPIPN